MAHMNNSPLGKSTVYSSAQKSGDFQKVYCSCEYRMHFGVAILALLSTALFAVGIAGLKGRVSGLSDSGAVAMTVIGAICLLCFWGSEVEKVKCSSS